ncbi:MAG: hypothetical protein XD50_1179 [Clostridia bacterium 41_269]|nr:MAG: hypothetical protein XD50_1179 [Clostridia bacterium 41_269]
MINNICYTTLWQIRTHLDGVGGAVGAVPTSIDRCGGKTNKEVQ